MSNQTPRGRSRKTKTAFQVKPVRATEVAIAILNDLTSTYPFVCNYTQAVALLRDGEIYLAYLEVEERNKEVVVTTPVQHWVTSQGSAAVKKLVDPSLDRNPNTFQTWFSNEKRCARLNRKFDILVELYRAGDFDRLKGTGFYNELTRFRSAIRYVLGDEPPLDDIAESAYYGPGSSTDVKGREVHYVRKLEGEECVAGSLELACRMLSHDKAVWAHIGMDPNYSHLPEARQGFERVMREILAKKVVDADHLMFVHKNIAVKRSICAQPSVSGALQLGFHVIIARLLKERCGIDLGNQGWNQALARKGSAHWRSSDPVCTLDKKDASALLCRNLVTHSLPAPWSKALMRTRTRGYLTPPEMGGEVLPYEMYGGMGNGTTFCIQTLVFWAGTYATSGASSPEVYASTGEFAVYGDDVALRKSHAVQYMRFMRFLGFRFNAKKTFLDGPFRESCGADFYDGEPVRPATVDSESGILSDLELIGIHNTLADGPYALKGACARIRALWKQNVYPQIPTDYAGNLGFRPIDVPYYSLVRTSDGTPVVSPTWQRPRTYVVEVRAKHADLGKVDPYTQIAIALLRARQSGHKWALPYRGLVNTKVVPERDMDRRDLVTMLGNSLRHLSQRKGTPWFTASRGLV